MEGFIELRHQPPVLLPPLFRNQPYFFQFQQLLRILRDLAKPFDGGDFEHDAQIIEIIEILEVEFAHHHFCMSCKMPA
jgi:hypothetical protein